MATNGKEAKQFLSQIARGLKRTVSAAGRKLSRLPSIVWKKGYRLSYIVGVQTIRCCRFIGRRSAVLMRPVGRFGSRLLERLLLRHLRAIAAETRRFREGFAIAGTRVRAAAKRHIGLGVLQVLCLPFLALKRHRRVAISLLNLAAPAAAAFVLVLTIQHWSSTTFALALEYDGQRLGYISDESVFDTAVAMATDRVINTDHSFEVVRTPKLTLTMVPANELLDETAVCDRILQSSDDAIAQVSGLYINGQFEGAVASRVELDELLDGLLAPYRTGADNETVSFLQEVSVLDGLYPVSSVIPVETMRERLTASSVVEKRYTVESGDTPIGIARANNMTLAELRTLNTDLEDRMYVGEDVLVQKAQPYLRVQVTRQITYTESIPFSIVQEKDSKSYEGVQKVKTEGKNGERLVTAEVVLLDGTEQERTILSSTVVSEPVNEVVLIGSKKRPSSSGNVYTPNTSISNGDGVNTGRFVYPVPAVTRIYQRFGRGHSGVDFSSGSVPIFNQKIVAVDGGTVVEVNTNPNAGYGLYVVIDHGDGIRTLYAHCNSLSVVKGQKVSQGQEIARAGRTGNSTGPHLHFEVRVNGKCVNPENYLP